MGSQAALTNLVSREVSHHVDPATEDAAANATKVGVIPVEIEEGDNSSGALQEWEFEAERLEAVSKAEEATARELETTRLRETAIADAHVTSSTEAQRTVTTPYDIAATPLTPPVHEEPIIGDVKPAAVDTPLATAVQDATAAAAVAREAVEVIKDSLSYTEAQLFEV